MEVDQSSVESICVFAFEIAEQNHDFTTEILNKKEASNQKFLRDVQEKIKKIEEAKRINRLQLNDPAQRGNFLKPLRIC